MENIIKCSLDGELWRRVHDQGDGVQIGIYYASSLGRIVKVYKNGKEHIMSYYSKKKDKCKKYYVKIHNYERIVAQVIYEAFYGRIQRGCSVYHVNGIKSDNAIANLRIATKSELGKKTGFRSGKAKAVYDIDNNRFYRSVREAARHLYVSSETVRNICLGKTKKPMYALMYDPGYKDFGANAKTIALYKVNDGSFAFAGSIGKCAKYLDVRINKINYALKNDSTIFKENNEYRLEVIKIYEAEV